MLMGSMCKVVLAKIKTTVGTMIGLKICDKAAITKLWLDEPPYSLARKTILIPALIAVAKIKPKNKLGSSQGLKNKIINGPAK